MSCTGVIEEKIYICKMEKFISVRWNNLFIALRWKSLYVVTLFSLFEKKLIEFERLVMTWTRVIWAFYWNLIKWLFMKFVKVSRKVIEIRLYYQRSCI